MLSRLGSLLLRMALGAAVADVVFDTALGVPRGVVATFLVGTITFLVFFILGRRAAGRGLVPGQNVRPLDVLGRDPIGCAIATGIVWSWYGNPANPLTAALVAVGAALVAILPEPDRTADPRWSRTAPPGRSYPFDYIDTGGLAITDTTRGCSGTPTWRLVVSGMLEVTSVRTALIDLVARYPILSMRVQALDGVPPWSTRYRYAEVPSFSVDDIFRVADLRGDPGAVDAVEREEKSRPLDPFTDFPVTLTLVLLDDDRCRLIFRQHHAIADGRAFMGLLEDFAAFLEAARRGVRPATDQLAAVPRRIEVDALGLDPAEERRQRWRGVRVVLGVHAHALLAPLRPLLQNVGADYSGGNDTVHWVVPEDALAPWNAARHQWGVSLNSFLTAAWLIALRRWHLERRAPVGRTSALVLQETRPRTGTFVSFANHLAFPEVEIRLDRVSEVESAARVVQAQMNQEKERHTAVQRLLAERWVIRFVPLLLLRRIALDSKRPAQSTSFSNLISLPFPPLGGESWTVDEVLITTPVQPRTGISLTVIRYNGRVVFNFNYKTTVVSRGDVEELAGCFARVLKEVAGTEAGGRWC